MFYINILNLKMSNSIRNQKPTIYCRQETQFKYKDTKRLKENRKEKDIAY